MTDPVDISCPEIAIVNIEKGSAAIGVDGHGGREDVKKKE